MAGKSDRRLIRIEEKLEGLERVLREVRRLVDHHETFLMGDEPLPIEKKESVMGEFHDSMEKAGVDPYRGPGPFGVAEEVREKGDPAPSLGGGSSPAKGRIPEPPETKGKSSRLPPEPGFAGEGRRSLCEPPHGEPCIPKAGWNSVKDEVRRMSNEELERKAYELNEEGRDWKEVEEELGMKAPWLAAGRWRKKIERGEV